MIIRNLDSDGDMTFGQGKQNYLTGQNAIALNIKTRLLCFLNNCVWDMASGIDWFTYLRKPGYKNQIVLAVKSVILQSFGVVKVNQVSVSALGVQPRSLALSYNVTTVYSSNFSAELSNLQEMINVNSK